MGLRSKLQGRGSVNVQIGEGAQLSNNIIKVSGGALHEGGLLNVHTTAAERAEDSPAPDAAATPPGETLVLFRTLAGQFNLEELETICWELGIKYEDLPAQTLSGKARQLVDKAGALYLLEGLRDIVNRERPAS